MKRYNARDKKNEKKAEDMVQISAIIPNELRKALVSHVRSNRMTMSEYITRAVANALGRPDLAEIPRPLAGRRPKVPEEAPAP